MDTQKALSKNSDESVLRLIQGIFQDMRTLSTKEILAAKLEIKQEVAKIAKAGVTLAIGAYFLGTGLLLLSLMLVFLLVHYTVLVLWSGLGIVGLAYLVLGAIVMILGKKKAENARPMPRETLRRVKDDVRSIGGKAARP